MTGRPFLLVLLLTAFLLGGGPSPPREGAETVASPTETRVPPAPAEERQRGVCWVAGRQPVTAEDLQPLVAAGVNWISQTPFGWQRSFNTPQVQLITEGRVYWGETDEGLLTTTRLAREAGIRTLLKPHIWLRDRSDGKWVGEIRMENEEDWSRWFESYRAFILHYARLAERGGIEALAVGTELHAAAREREADWRRLIAEIRQLYRGKLTYSANWYREFQEVGFWDALDWIGIQAYFPLSDRERPDLPELTGGWLRHLPALEELAARYGKPVIFTEIGYRSAPDAAIEPWRWPQRPYPHGAAPLRPGEVDLETQARCYEAFFQTFWGRGWFGGAYFWKWYPKYRGDGDWFLADFTPQFKPAQEVMTRWYGGSR